MKTLVTTTMMGMALLGHVDAATTVETFGGTNISFVDVVNVGGIPNLADTDTDTDRLGRGAVGYDYRIGQYEITRGQIDAYNADTANASNLITMSDMTSFGGNGSDRPATGVSWNEAARFVNWLNTSQGHAVAYQFDATGGNANISLWEAGDAGYDASNPFRSSLAEYWLPSVDEWYKAAYYDPTLNGGTGGYNNWATGSSAPTTTSGGTAAGTAVFRDFVNMNPPGPADVDNAGGLSFYRTMGQSGNVWEWEESAYDGSNNSAGESRELRGGNWGSGSGNISASIRFGDSPTIGSLGIGFRVAGSATAGQVPEPSTLLLSVIGAIGLVARRRRR